jgi:hypothetical protein
MGGSYFTTAECIRRLYRNNRPGRHDIRWGALQEDWIFGLLIYSVGLRHGDSRARCRAFLHRSAVSTWLQHGYATSPAHRVRQMLH